MRSNDAGGKAGIGTTMTAGGALLARLKMLGVDYIFANSGTDFQPMIEGSAEEARAKQIDLPQALVMPHESAAMGMAHGYFCATGKVQAVMAHTNVGLANCAIGAINAATDHVPVLLLSGKTPVVHRDRLGARTVPIGWGQEVRDQAPWSERRRSGTTNCGSPSRPRRWQTAPTPSRTRCRRARST